MMGYSIAKIFTPSGNIKLMVGDDRVKHIAVFDSGGSTKAVRISYESDLVVEYFNMPFSVSQDFSKKRPL